MIPATQAELKQLERAQIEFMANRTLAAAAEKKDERIRMYRPGQAEAGREFGWCSREEAEEMVDTGLAEWSWYGRKIEVASLSAGIRDRSCSYSGVSRGYSQKLAPEKVRVGIGKDGKERFKTVMVPQVTPGDPAIDPGAGMPVLEINISALEALAMSEMQLSGLAYQIATETGVGSEA